MRTLATLVVIVVIVILAAWALGWFDTAVVEEPVAVEEGAVEEVEPEGEVVE